MNHPFGLSTHLCLNLSKNIVSLFAKISIGAKVSVAAVVIVVAAVVVVVAVANELMSCNLILLLMWSLYVDYFANLLEHFTIKN